MNKGTFRYIVARSCATKGCPRCNSISNAIVVNRKTHHTMFCPDCGAYIKHCSMEDMRYVYLEKIDVNIIETPLLVLDRYAESQKTMVKR